MMPIQPLSLKRLGRTPLSLTLGILYALSLTTPLVLALAVGSPFQSNAFNWVMIVVFLILHFAISVGLVLRVEGAWLPAVAILCLAVAVKLFSVITARGDDSTTGAMILLLVAVAWDLVVGSLLLWKGRTLFPVLIPGKSPVDVVK